MNIQVSAYSKSVKVSPRKVRLMADLVRKMTLSRALDTLVMTNKRAALPLAKTVKSAIANAKNNKNIDIELLKIMSIDVTEGQVMKRFHPSTRGRIHPYKKRTSNIRVVLEASEQKVKKNETKKAEVNIEE